VILLAGVSKTFRSLTGRRSVAALREFSLELTPGEVVGIAGPNGAGKSTLISLVLGFLHPSSGTVKVGGQSPREYVETHGVGYLAEVFALPPRWGVMETLQRFAVLGRLGGSAASLASAARRIESVIELTGLGEHRRKLVKQLSKGTLQRLGLAQALLVPRQLVILDEPTHGLDPVWTQNFRDIVLESRSPDRAILIASHNLDELERVADRVAIIHQGQLQRIVRAGEGGRGGESVMLYRLALAEPFPAIGDVFPGATEVPGRALEYQIEGDLTSLNHGMAALLSRGGRIASFTALQSGLEREFRQAIEGNR
jgi:ABC-type multidrug transport system ATPase subunit